MAILDYISTEEVIGKVYRDLNIEQEDRWMDMIEWIAEALHKIGAHPQYIPKTESLTIENYRVALPCDLFRIQQIEHNRVPLIKLTGSFDIQEHVDDDKNIRTEHTYGYIVNDAFIQTNFQDGDIIVSYIATPTDEKTGFPMIPNDEGYKEAIERYIVMRLKYPEYIAGTYNPNLFKDIEKSWHKYCAQARGNANMPTTDELESIKKQWVRLMPQMNSHKRFFNNLNDGERVAGNSIYGNGKNRY